MTTASLARIRLNPHSRAVQRDLRDATQLHKTLMRLVPDNLGNTPRQDAGLLYRLDEDQHASILLVQATSPLTPDRLPSHYGQIEVKDLAAMFTALRKDLAVRYRIVVNPSKRERLPQEGKKQLGKVIPLSGADAEQWWARRADGSGLHLHTVQGTSLRAARAHSSTSAMRHNLIRYEGTATITDPQALTTALLDGIGRGKSYGAGLLTLAPAATP